MKPVVFIHGKIDSLKIIHSLPLVLPRTPRTVNQHAHCSGSIFGLFIELLCVRVPNVERFLHDLAFV